jgi:hypothetical protein
MSRRSLWILGSGDCPDRHREKWAVGTTAATSIKTKRMFS